MKIGKVFSWESILFNLPAGKLLLCESFLFSLPILVRANKAVS